MCAQKTVLAALPQDAFVKLSVLNSRPRPRNTYLLTGGFNCLQLLLFTLRGLYGFLRCRGCRLVSRVRMLVAFVFTHKLVPVKY